MINPDVLNVTEHYRLQYGSASGQYFIYNPKTKTCSEFRTCRVEFGWFFNKADKYIGFCKSKIDIDLLNKFFEHVEKAAGVKGTGTEFFKTQYDSTVIIKLSPFWLKYKFRRHLLTLFIRCGAVHYFGDFNKAIEAYGLTHSILPSIDYFMKGNTVPTFYKFKKDHDGYEGLIATLRGLNNKEIAEKLVKAS